jgi:hypothetical protein
MDLKELIHYRKQRLEELDQKKKTAIAVLNKAVEDYKAHIKASENEVTLTHAKGLSFVLSVLVGDLEWKIVIDLKIDSANKKFQVFAVLDNISEILLSSEDNTEFGKAINSRIIHAIDKEASRFDK